MIPKLAAEKYGGEKRFLNKSLASRPEPDSERIVEEKVMETSQLIPFMRSKVFYF